MTNLDLPIIISINKCTNNKERNDLEEMYSLVNTLYTLINPFDFLTSSLLIVRIVTRCSVHIKQTNIGEG